LFCYLHSFIAAPRAARACLHASYHAPISLPPSNIQTDAGGCETKFFAVRFLRDRSICDPIYSFGATFALSPRVRGESRREGTLFRHLKNFVSHPMRAASHPVTPRHGSLPPHYFSGNCATAGYIVLKSEVMK
jgi:hypothetical protein